MAEQLNEDNENKKEIPASMPKVGTDCNQCIFSNVQGKKCYLGKLDKFLENGAQVEERDGQYLIDRICMFRRTDGWKKEHRRRRNIAQCGQEAKAEVNICGTIVIYADDMDNLKTCVEKLSKVHRIGGFNVVIAHYQHLKIREVYEYINEQDHIKDMVAIQVKGEGEINFLDEAIKRSKNGFIVTLDSDKDVDTDILNKLYKFLYEEMHKFLYIKPSDGIHECVIPATIYKFAKGNKVYTFEEKMQAMSKEQNIESQILTWEQLNESIS